MKKTKLLVLLAVALASAMIFLLAACGPAKPALESISATYNAVPNAGSLIDVGGLGIVVTAHYEGGSEEVIEKGWVVENPGRLVGAQTNTYTISYEGKTCELVIKVISEESQDYSNLGTDANDLAEEMNGVGGF